MQDKDEYLKNLFGKDKRVAIYPFDEFKKKTPSTSMFVTGFEKIRHDPNQVTVVTGNELVFPGLGKHISFTKADIPVIERDFLKKPLFFVVKCTFKKNFSIGNVRQKFKREEKFVVILNTEDPYVNGTLAAKLGEEEMKTNYGKKKITIKCTINESLAKWFKKHKELDDDFKISCSHGSFTLTNTHSDSCADHPLLSLLCLPLQCLSFPFSLCSKRSGGEGDDVRQDSDDSFADEQCPYTGYLQCCTCCNNPETVKIEFQSKHVVLIEKLKDQPQSQPEGKGKSDTSREKPQEEAAKIESTLDPTPEEENPANVEVTGTSDDSPEKAECQLLPGMAVN